MDGIPGNEMRKYFAALVAYRCDEIQRAAAALETGISGLPLSTEEMDAVLVALEDCRRALVGAIAMGRSTDSTRPA